MKTAVVLFTRDLRAHDQPALAAAVRDAREVVPLFVRDPAIPASARRLALLDELLAELPWLEVRSGDPVDEVARFDPDAVYCSEDASQYAVRRETRLADRFDLRLHPGVTVVGLGDVKPYRVFTPYFRAWARVPRRAVERAPWKTPKTRARAELERWLRRKPETGSGLSPYLHFGSLSPLECAVRGDHKPAFVRQLCWRDFYAQLLRHRPRDFALWDAAGSGEHFEAWRAGQTGYPLVDAGMRQLRAEGLMPNRVRLVTASFLVHDLGLDWRVGARHFEELLLDADVASNRGNWLWVVANRHRIFNPARQAKQFPEYIERWVDVGARGYPDPIVDHEEAVAAVRRKRQSANAGRPSIDSAFRSRT